MILQLNPSYPVDTPKGKARAVMAIDYSEDHYLLFVCAIDATGEFRIYRNSEITLQKNETMGVRSVEPETPEHVQGTKRHDFDYDALEGGFTKITTNSLPSE